MKNDSSDPRYWMADAPGVACPLNRFKTQTKLAGGHAINRFPLFSAVVKNVRRLTVALLEPTMRVQLIVQLIPPAAKEDTDPAAN